jgi:signal transduction histidine kinase
VPGLCEEMLGALARAGDAGAIPVEEAVAVLARHAGSGCAVYRRGQGGDLILCASVPADEAARPAPEGPGRSFPLSAGGREVGVLVIDSPGPTLPSLDEAATLLGLALAASGASDGRARSTRPRDDAQADAARRLRHAGDEAGVAGVAVASAAGLLTADVAVLYAGAAGGRTVLAAQGWQPGDPDPAVLAYAGDPAPGEAVWMGRELAVGLGGPSPGVGGGLLAVVRREGEVFGDQEVDRLVDLARDTTIALQNVQLLERVRREGRKRDALAAALVDAQEQERRRVAEDLHDGPVQELVGTSLLLDALAAQLDDAAPSQRRDAAQAASSARDALRALRRAIFDLHPMALDELGFAAALRTLVERLQWQGVDVHLDVAAADALSPALRTVAFRTCQEGIANIQRHAGAHEVGITARQEGQSVIIEIADDGRGFTPGDVDLPGIAHGHIGLPALRERASLVGGDLQVLSSEGRGTTLRLTLPLTRS